LVQTHARLPNRVAPLDRILELDRLRLVDRPAQRARRDEHHLRLRIVRAHEAREDRLVPARPRPDEVDERHLELVRRPQRAVVRLVDVAGAVCVEEAVLDGLVVVRRVRRGLNGERSRTSLDRRPIDPLLAVEERNALPTEGEAVRERTGVRNVLAELSDEK
jgi:hypothetical protein